MRKREFDPDHPELMDLAVLENGKPSSELERDLKNLRWLNRHFGAISILHRFLKRWYPKPPEGDGVLRVLDLATGEGDLPKELVLWCRLKGIPVQVDAVDLNEATLAVARERSRGFPEITFHQGDIRHWDCTPRELVLCSLALHHFSDDDALLVLKNARRLSSRHLLVADLERSLPGAIGIHLLTAVVLRERMTVHDARLSIRRAFSFDELAMLAQEAGWREFGHARFPVTRQAIWVERLGR
jgi:SAM-dependent methyltransferase